MKSDDKAKKLLGRGTDSQNNKWLMSGTVALLRILKKALIVVFSIIIRLILNVVIFALLAVVIVVKLLSWIPIPLIVLPLWRAPGLAPWLLDKIRFLVHRLIIPASNYDKSIREEVLFVAVKQRGEVISHSITRPDWFTEYLKDTPSLVFVLGGNGQNSRATEEVFKGLKPLERCTFFSLPHFAQDYAGKSYSTDTLIDRYVSEMKQYVRDGDNVTSIKLVGHSMGGAVLTLALERMLEDKDFDKIQKFELYADRTFTDLGQVTRSTGMFGFLYFAWPLLSAIGWNISPHKAMQNILAKHSNRNIDIYINSAENDEMLGSGTLRGYNYFSSGTNRVFGKILAGIDQHNTPDRLNPTAFRENKYFERHYESCESDFKSSYGVGHDLKSGKVTGISDKQGYAGRVVVRADLQMYLASLLEQNEAGSLDLSTKLLAAQKTYTRDRQLENAKELFYPIAKIIFGLCLVILLSVNILLAPLSGFIFAAMFLVSNIYQNGLYSKLNIGFGIAAVAFAALTVLGVLSLAGITIIASTYFFGFMMVAFTVVLFLTAVARGALRSIEAKGYVESSLSMNIELCVNLSQKIATEKNSEKKARYEKQLEVALASYEMLSSEQENLVRTIKNPFGKYFTHIKNAQNRIAKIKGIDGLDDGTKQRLLGITNDSKNTMVQVLQRDVPWLTINITLIAITALVAIGLLPVTVNLMIAVISLGCISGVIPVFLRIYTYNKSHDLGARVITRTNGSAIIKNLLAGLDLIGGFSLHVLANIMLAILLVGAIVAKVLAMLPIPLIGQKMGSVLGFGSWLLAEYRFLAYRMLMPGNSEYPKKTTEYARGAGEVTKLSFVLGGKMAANDSGSLSGSDNKQGLRMYSLPYFAPSNLNGDCTVDMLSRKYVEELAKYVSKNPQATEINLTGAGLHSAILALALEKVLVDVRFSSIKNFNLCLNESFTSLGGVTRGTGVLGFLYPAGPLLSVIGWNLSPASSRENILAKYNSKVKIKISSSKYSSALFGKAVLAAKPAEASSFGNTSSTPGVGPGYSSSGEFVTLDPKQADHKGSISPVRLDSGRKTADVAKDSISRGGLGSGP